MEIKKMIRNPEPTESHIPHLNASGASPTDGESGRKVLEVLPSKDWFAVLSSKKEYVKEDGIRLIGWALIVEPGGRYRTVGLCPIGFVDEVPDFIGYYDNTDRMQVRNRMSDSFKRDFLVGEGPAEVESEGGA